MSKGITAFVIVLAVVMSISILSGLGFYAELHLDYDDQGMDDDTQAAADAFTDQQASDTSSSAIVEFTTGAANTLQSAWQVISNTSGVVKLLFGVPSSLANTIETFFRIVFGISFAAFIRGVVMT